MIRLLSLLRAGWSIRLRYVKTARSGSATCSCSCNSIASDEADERRIFTTTSTTTATS